MARLARRGKHRRKTSSVPKAERGTLTIASLGQRGDGIASHGDHEPLHAPIYVAGALPGETIEADISDKRGHLITVKEGSPSRVKPPCPHFLSCGGCSLQHLATNDYLAWKREQVVDALRRRGIDAPIAPVEAVPPASRRRATLVARRAGNSVRIGFHGARSHTIVPIEICSILTPEIMAAWPAFQELAEIATPERGDLSLSVLATRSGLDVVLKTAGTSIDPSREAKLVNAAIHHDIARLSANDIILMKLREPELSFDDVTVSPPTGSFVQASSTSETIMAHNVLEIIDGAHFVADLFAGCGTFSLRAARKAAIAAFESEQASLDAMLAAHRRTTGLQPLTVKRRDLFEFPLSANELKPYDAVVINPPRAGAEAQARALASAEVPTIAYASCAPGTFARDARILIDGGYHLSRITPVDQFVYTHHIELIAALERRTN